MIATIVVMVVIILLLIFALALCVGIIKGKNEAIDVLTKELNNATNANKISKDFLRRYELFTRQLIEGNIYAEF